jgi:hypothetical protein
MVRLINGSFYFIYSKYLTFTQISTQFTTVSHTQFKERAGQPPRGGGSVIRIREGKDWGGIIEG